MESHPFRLIRNIGRTSEIVTVLLNHGFSDLVDRIGLRSVWYRSRQIFSRKPHEPARHVKMVERIRVALESLGPTYIKFGQVMSTRPDLVPQEMLKELKKLQERVPPFPSREAVERLETELGAPVSELFANFDETPLAAGSLGQVHRAVHFDGTPLAVKIRRPGAVRNVERDLALMYEIAVLIDRNIAEARIFDPVGLVNHFARSIRRELNFAREGRTMDEFRRLFRQDATLYVPTVYWDLTTEAVLTMEYIDGLRIDELPQQAELFRVPAVPGSTTDVPAAIRIDPAQVAANGARIFMKQAFEFGVFHGDPHPGNIRIKRDGTICLLDYGMIGMLDEKTREQLIDLLVAISRQNVDAAVKLVLLIGEAYTEIDRVLLQVDMRDFIANYYGIPLERMNVGRLLSDFVGILANHGIRCPGSLMLLIRSLVTLEGIGRELDPDFNLATHLQPFVERMVRQRFQPTKIAERMLEEARKMVELAHEMPLYVNRTMKKISENDLRIQLEHRNLDHFIMEMERSSNRLVVGMVVAALIVASALILAGKVSSPWISVPMYVSSSLLAIWLVFGIFRSGRL
ncbi:MAG: AarF/ABC1/UbiB kinase family protein [Planctomycetes bacterium]|nr:AarF/ABC1/UbiB kinase family protein [Planctomycetota bacterium]